MAHDVLMNAGVLVAALGAIRTALGSRAEGNLDCAVMFAFPLGIRLACKGLA